MGKISQGILGGLSGKVGNVIGGSWKGIDYIRIKPSSVANPRSEGQVNQRSKFTVTLEFLQAVKPFIKQGYKSLAVKKTEFNAAMSYILNNAVTGIAPDFFVEYSEALVSRGSLSGVINGTFDLSVPGEITFGWSDNSAEGNANTTDKVMLLVYNPNMKDSISVIGGNLRTETTQTVTIPNTYAGESLELFMAFMNADGSVSSNSTYLGSGTAQ